MASFPRLAAGSAPTSHGRTGLPNGACLFLSGRHTAGTRPGEDGSAVPEAVTFSPAAIAAVPHLIAVSGAEPSPPPERTCAVLPPESGSVGRHGSAAGDAGSRLRTWRNTGDGERPRAQVEVVEGNSWLGGRESRCRLLVRLPILSTIRQRLPAATLRRENHLPPLSAFRFLMPPVPAQWHSQ